jgi:hypothetical protein
MLNSQFWPTAAQVMPVLALAIVVEARLITSRWNDGVPQWLRFVQCVVWIGPLILFFYLEPLAFSVISGSQSTKTSVSLVIDAIRVSLGSLLIAPATELLFRSNARNIMRTRVFIRSFKPKWEMRYGRRDAKRLLKRVRKDHKQWQEQLKTIEHIRQDVYAGDCSDFSKCRETLDECARIEATVRARLAKIDEIEGNITNILARVKESTEKLNAAEKAFIEEGQKLLTQMHFSDMGELKPPEDQ